MNELVQVAQQVPDLAPNIEQICVPTTLVVFGLYVFVLGMFVGFEVITKVPATLHTPLMSGSNAISGITIVGALLALGHAESGIAVSVLAGLAVAFATINVVGGYLVTDRMLEMFKSKGEGKK
jgi:NAD(P) transhydrogenase subunit alpha